MQGIIMKYKNNVKSIREQRLISKAELARLAGVSSVTIDRIESGADCRMETKRKILLALGFDLSEKDKVFQQKNPE
jgi:DNA-binding XRE family transcriptional regulator